MEDQERGALVRRLWEWGGTLDNCERRMQEINRLLKQAEDAENILRAQAATGMPRGGENGDPTGRAVCMRDSAMRRIDQLTREINEIMQRKAEMDAAVRPLTEKLQLLLHMRYVQGWTLTIKIPQAMHISERTAYYWHEQSLQEIARNLV